MFRGYIKTWRKILSSSMYQQLTACQRDVFWACLLSANHQAKQWEWQGEIFECQAGQFVTSLASIKKLCARDTSTRNIRTALDKLEKWQFLTNKSTKQGRLITIINWDTYQSQEIEADKGTDKRLTKDRQTTDKRLTTNNNDKNEKECIYNPPTPQNGNHAKALKLYNEYIQTCKPTPDHRSRSRCITNLVYYLEHFSFEDLQKSIVAYAESKKTSERIFIKDPANFFGKRDPVFSDYIEKEEDQGWTLN